MLNVRINHRGVQTRQRRSDPPRKPVKKKRRHHETCGPEEQSEQDNAYYIQSNYTAVYAVYEQHVQTNRECYNFKERSLEKHT